ncbi:PREDICTED: prostate and testis expressed protein 4 [Dipodomys ordii]|uniref:Prostate and testis expressed protein 4 n=1 Tax=Dipodomys ordii TaxID=10020 RepID=A0A1S3EN53_DIPOR|nr:PREDICTED: prostate and testis expressed protein 4 [Dipodomys ordii]
MDGPETKRLEVTKSFQHCVFDLIKRRNAPTCRYAHNATCLSGEGTCLTPKHGSCSTISHYKGKHLYSQQMCKHNCYEDQYTYRNEMNVTLCCNRNLCNIY